MGAKCECFGVVQEGRPGWKIREPLACVLLSMGQPGFVETASTNGRDWAGEQFSSCHPALSALGTTELWRQERQERGVLGLIARPVCPRQSGMPGLIAKDRSRKKNP